MENSNSSESASSGRVGSSSEGGGGSDAVEESQEDEPSSSFPALPQVENELESFRLQWKREIESSPFKEKSTSLSRISSNIDGAKSVEEKAKYLFLNGVKAERLGKLQDAISFYRRAIQLVPDIEFKIEESMCDYFDDSEEESSDESEIEENLSGSECEIDNLVDKLKKITVKSGVSSICQPKLDQKASHISCLPPEIFLYILKWLVSQDLDVVSLEQIAKVCRGFYLGARDPEMWKLICFRTWDMNVENPNRYGSWRNMFIQRPHLSFNGVYISKTTYVRYGESSFQDTNYRPCYLVEYYRYLHFFPDGFVLMLTTPDDPYQSLYKLRDKKCKDPNIMEGHYKLIGSTVIATVKKTKESANPLTSYLRFRRQRPVNLQENQDQTFHLELEVKSIKKRINCQLNWRHYSIHSAYRNGQETVSNFDIVPSNFPCFWFSRVKSYTAESESPLQ